MYSGKFSNFRDASEFLGALHEQNKERLYFVHVGEK